MPSLEIHCKESIEKLGEDFSLVHRYLDRFASQFNGDQHRQILHHTEGVHVIRRVFGKRYGFEYGNRAALAAELHIMADYGIDHVPTKAEVMNVLLAFDQGN